MNLNEEKPLENITSNWLRASSCFKGRNDTLNEIKELFETKQIVVIHGGPGFGKTETARHFAENNSEYFNGNLFWVYAENQENIQKSIKEFAAILDIKTTDVSPIYNKFRKSRCLFIFDNVENMAAISNFLPSGKMHPTISVLITSQFSEWDESVSKVPIEALELEDALDILRHKLGDKVDSSKIWEDLVHHLEGIPLSIRIVSCLLHKKLQFPKFDLHDFIDSLSNGNFINSKYPKSEQDHYKESVLSLIYIAIDRLKNEEMEETPEQTHPSFDLLCFIAYMDAEHIYYRHLLSVPSINGSNEILEKALNKLKDYSLIQFDLDKYDYKIKVHRTIQVVLRKYELNELNGISLKALLKIVLEDTYFGHLLSTFKYVEMEEYQEISFDFFNEIKKNETLLNLYFSVLVADHSENILRILLPTFKKEFYKTDKYNKILNYILTLAIINKNTNIRTIDVLINFGAKVTCNYENNVANGFHDASSWLSKELFDRLLESNDSETIINSKDYLGRTILHFLVLGSDKDNVAETIDCMDHLITKWKADISIRDRRLNSNILHIACENENICLEMIKYLVKKSNCKHLVNTQNNWNLTPLYFIFIYNSSNSDLLEIVSYFIKECGGDMTIGNYFGHNPLFFVCRNGTSKTIDFVLRLINCREIINIQDKWGNVAFTQLMYNDKIEEDEIIELIKLFIQNEMVFKVRNKENKTLDEIAKQNGFIKLADLI